MLCSCHRCLQRAPYSLEVSGSSWRPDTRCHVLTANSGPDVIASPSWKHPRVSSSPEAAAEALDAEQEERLQLQGRVFLWGCEVSQAHPEFLQL